METWMALPLRPRPYAERPKSAVLLPQPANDNAQDPRGLGKSGGNPLGHIENGAFRFASPEAEEQWIRDAYQSGVNAETWQLGDEIDEQTAELAKAGLGGPMPAIYLGPDGKHRTINAKTIESAAVRDHRNRQLSGMTMDQIAAAGKMPGEDEWVEQWKAKRANDNQPTTGSEPQGAATPSPGADTGPVQRYGRAGVALPKPSNETASQDAEDLARIGWNSVLGDYGDEGRAALGAVDAWWDGESFTDAYDERLAREKGTAAEMATGFIPVVGDVSGFVSDFKDWKENGDQWGWGDYGMVAAGLVPWVPSRRVIKKGKKAIDDLLADDQSRSRIGNELIETGKGNKQTTNIDSHKVDYGAELAKARQNILTEGQARKLDRSTRGIIYVREKATGTPESIEFMKSHPDVIWFEDTQEFAVPALCFDNPNPRGRNFVKLDLASVFGEGAEAVLVDVKTKMAIWDKQTQDKARNTLERVKYALLQNPGYKVTYEFKTEKAAQAALNFIDKHNYSRFIEVRVRGQ
jgi:hypothetical protein